MNQKNSLESNSSQSNYGELPQQPTTLNQKKRVNYSFSNNFVIFGGGRSLKTAADRDHVVDPLIDFFTFDSKFMTFITKSLKLIAEFFLLAWIVITITFFLINSVPGESALTIGITSPEAKKAILAQYGLDRPLGVRYADYLANIFRGEFGVSTSIRPGVEINSFIWSRYLVSFAVGIFSVLLTLVIGIPLGIFVGRKPGGVLDSVSTVIISIVSAVPSLVFGLILLLIGKEIGLPFTFDINNFVTYILPGLALSLGSIIVYVQYIKVEMNRELNSMHAKFAYLKGATVNRFVWLHALKPSLFPIATFFPFVILGSFVGALFIEQIFQIPGSGSLFFEAIISKDYNVILLLVIIYSLITIIGYTIRDALYQIIDPRIRRGGK
ncbi:ABC transporter permease [Ureaplasma urealyticum]|uniref:ABC transporter permease n=2 Tax=Ureaplasma urealyticum TaxID=2130 RepID=A0AAP9ACU8_UREUR|nr:ABC transporter permease [Ureaplasma urealyticum]EDX53579.1 oligopeptide transport system permease protein [Ureaplasma urealyticum serovar 9 str. ATCC 33175]EDU06035.1 oligopeptide transport system permease protein [Ureaplasma urealyticum serovar 5 str. ATCC 27817]EDU67212.1 oligopeptide transport system permease protein [Ureaplasma urealyticum serovar 11 str. ATCC 33695]EDX53101.1 oligopeptide transport system permease protein [Ureaplasma urealyticum serovar 12 str. ATCC 33696]EDY74725.1 o